MKKIIVPFLILLLSLVLFISAGADFDVSERARIGIKYGSTAVSDPSVGSTTGSFDFHFLGDEITYLGSYKTKTINVKHYSSYLVVEASWFESMDDAIR